MNHQQMEKFVSKSDANILINIDTHSDFVDRRVTEFNCGTWTAYVSWRKEGKYIWYRSNESAEFGCCNPAVGGEEWNWNSDWKESSGKYIPQRFSINKYIDFNNVVGVGLCLSPDYNQDRWREPYSRRPELTFEQVFRDIVKKYNLPYLKGRRNENFGRERYIDDSR